MTQIIEYRTKGTSATEEWSQWREYDPDLRLLQASSLFMELRIARTYTKGMVLVDSIGSTYEILDDVKYISKNSNGEFECMAVRKTFSNGHIMHSFIMCDMLNSLKEI